MSKLLIIGTPENTDVKFILESLNRLQGASFKTIPVTSNNGVIEKWGESVIDTVLGELAALELLQCFSEFGILLKYKVADTYDIPAYLLGPEAEPVKQNNKPWYQDHRNNRSKKMRRKL